LEAAIWVIGIIAAVLILAIYIISSVNKYSNSFVGKYFDEEKKNAASENTSKDKEADEELK